MQTLMHILSWQSNGCRALDCVPWLQSTLEKAKQQHVLGSMDENDPDADEELEEGDYESEGGNEDDGAANDLADALASKAQIN